MNQECLGTFEVSSTSICAKMESSSTYIIKRNKLQNCLFVGGGGNWFLLYIFFQVPVLPFIIF